MQAETLEWEAALGTTSDAAFILTGRWGASPVGVDPITLYYGTQSLLIIKPLQYCVHTILGKTKWVYEMLYPWAVKECDNG